MLVAVLRLALKFKVSLIKKVSDYLKTRDIIGTLNLL